VPKQALRMKTSEFESKAYTGAESKEDYLRRIARGLPEVERQVIDQQKSSDENSSAEGTACDVEDIGSGGSSSASATSKKEDISVAYDTSPVDSTSSSLSRVRIVSWSVVKYSVRFTVSIFNFHSFMPQ